MAVSVEERTLRFRRPVRTAFGTVRERTVLELSIDGGRGEAAPLEPYDGVPLREAREALARGALDLVVLDVHLPDGAGLDLALEIRDADLVRPPRILVLSASVLPAEQEAAMTAGCDAFMAKPYRPTELLTMIETLTSADD